MHKTLRTFSHIFALAFYLASSPLTFTANVTFEPNIRIDQFGYLPDAPKVAVISEPVVGFNAPSEYSAAETYQVREWFSEAVVFTGSAIPWKNGALHEQSGDRGAWFDFSEHSETGTFYIYDPENDVASYPFEIRSDVYNDVLKMAFRTFFIQRLDFDRLPPYIEEKWSDTAAFAGPEQDYEARSRWAKDDPATAKDLRGGWMDAGDTNKYTTFAENVVIELLDAHELNPAVFTDLNGIPESGNGIPDILDEVIYELEFLKRMQDATGTGGFILKIGVDNHDAVQPLSADTRPRYYVPECTSATLAGANMFARAALLLKEVAGLEAYGAELEIRAIEAWERATVTTQNFTVFELDCDDQDVTSGDADRNEEGQMRSAVVSASYLHRLTGDEKYSQFFEENHTRIQPISNFYWGPYTPTVGRALLAYAKFRETSAIEAEEPVPEFATKILEQKASMTHFNSIEDREAGLDLYRAHLIDNHHTWGSNRTRSNAGNLNLNYNIFGLNPESAQDFHDTALEYLNWLHGVNALGKVQLSNMADYGAENSVSEFYHTWFTDGSDWDNVHSSKYGPPPGYLVGGPNRFYTGTKYSPPANQPPQKSYLDFNTGWPENSWEITENAIYYQSAYILLLSQLIPKESVSFVHPPGFESNFSVEGPNEDGIISLIGLSVDTYHLRLLSIQGDMIHEQAIDVNDSGAELLLPELEPGIYFIEMGKDGEGVVRKFKTQ